jgi:tripartite-type tricarboxylate transporter receptor subunit TctC
MKLLRRQFLRLVAGATALPAFTSFAWAQSYPTRLVRIIVGYAPGTAPDILARLMSQWLSERFGQPFVVENRPGAGSNIATEAAVNASPDGYTLLIVTAANATNATFYDGLKYNFVHDIAPVAGVDRGPLIMTVNPKLPAKTVSEFISYAKANPGKINMGSSGTGTLNHVAGELFKTMTGVDLVHVPYRSSVIPDLLAGQVQVFFVTPAASIEYIRAGQLRALAVTTATRSETLPDIPTIGEFVPGYEASSWYGVGAPKNTPAEIIDKLNKEISLALSDAKMKMRISDLGADPMPMTAASFGKLITAETEKWANVIRTANIKAD